MSDKIKVILVEDDPDFVFLIHKMIQQDAKLAHLGYASDAGSGVQMAQDLNPDIVLMDLNLSGSKLDGIEAAKEIRLTTNAKILLLTSFEQPDIVVGASKKSFASGYIFKSQCQTLTDVVVKTATSNTPQEQFIRELILSGLTTAERGVLNDILGGSTDTQTSSVKTIANQKTSIFRKLGLRNTGDLIRIFRK